MFFKKDINTQFLTQYAGISPQQNDAKHQNKGRMKQVPKNYSSSKNQNLVFQHVVQKSKRSERQNDPFFVSIAIDSQVSSGFMRKKQKNKKSIFLELKELQNPKRVQKPSNLKKTSINSGSSGVNYNLNFQQSKVDIIFSNSNLSDQSWGPSFAMDFQYPKNSLKNVKNFQSSKVAQVKMQALQMPKTENYISNRYDIKNSDRIMEESDENATSRIQKIFYDNITETTGLNNSTSFKKASISYDDLEFQEKNKLNQHHFMIIQSPLTQFNTNKTIKQTYELALSKISNQQIYQQKKQQSRKRPSEVLRCSNAKDLQNQSKSMRVSERNSSKNTFLLSQTNESKEFKEEMFEKINLYRFLNRLQYKIKKYFLFQSNLTVLQKLIGEIIILKCFILLNVEIELQSLEARGKKCSFSQKQLFLQIIREYIEKQSGRIYWQQVENSFRKVSLIWFSFSDCVLQFLNLTVSQIQKNVPVVKQNLQNKINSTEVLLFQIRVKILQYLYYDILKLKMTQNFRTDNIRDTPFNKQRRLMKIIQKNQWNEKIPLAEMVTRFEYLKQDLTNQN